MRGEDELGSVLHFTVQHTQGHDHSQILPAGSSSHPGTQLSMAPRDTTMSSFSLWAAAPTWGYEHVRHQGKKVMPRSFLWAPAGT